VTATDAAPETWVSAETHWSITKFLLDEAELLDHWRYGDWSTRITQDFWYRVPAPVTRDDPQRGRHAEGAYLVDETRGSLEYWFRRYDPVLFEYAWGENPLQRVHRFITNIRARQVAGSADVHVTANLLLSFARQSQPAVLISAERDDLLVPDGSSWLLAQRTVLLDQNVLDMPHLRVIF
jgi:3-phenylpropionate/cinnamic acid dioxygenase small subunit